MQLILKLNVTTFYHLLCLGEMWHMNLTFIVHLGIPSMDLGSRKNKPMIIFNITWLIILHTEVTFSLVNRVSKEKPEDI